jgi:protein SCO1/2
MMSPRRFLFTCALALAVAGCKEPVPLHGVGFAEMAAAAPLALTDAEGRAFDLATQLGKVTVIYFGYTHCPDICPTTLQDWAKARKALGAVADKAQFVFVSMDPERDTPKVALDYARQFDPSFLGFAPTAAQLEGIKKAWGIDAFREAGADSTSYGVAHPAQAFVIDQQGKLHLLFPPGMPVADIVSDLRQLL